jgi:lipopolysaccharide assembly outer membrane protein LptD (OstA)
MLFVVASVMATRSVINISHEPYRYDDPDPKPALVEILNSDVLYKRSTDPRADILVGNVKIKHEGAFLNCDSARYYKDDNSFYAYGRVYLVQGDTLKLYCDTLDYYGDSRVAKARGKVRLHHRNRRLETKKLEYARLQGEAKYYEGGTIYQEDKVLYSYYGEYNTFTHLAVFTQDAKLRDSQNTITCDVGQYNTNTHISILKNNVVLTNKDGNVMYSDNGKYDSDQHFMQAWDNVRIVDKDKNQLFCDRGDYNSDTKLANCYDNVRSVDTKGNVLECDKGDYNTDTKLMHCFDNVKLTDTDANVLLCEEG